MKQWNSEALRFRFRVLRGVSESSSPRPERGGRFSWSKRRLRGSRLLKNLGLYALMIAAALVMLLPLRWALATSLTPVTEGYGGAAAVTDPRSLWAWPSTLDWSAYLSWIGGLVPYMARSLVVTGLAIALQLVLSSLSGFALARLEFRGRSWVERAYLAGILLPVAVTLVPNFVVMARLKLIDNLWSLILPAAFHPLATIICRQYYRRVPRELDDSARLDGASWVRIWRSIYMPLSRPAFAMLATFTFVFTWNDYLWPLLMLNTHGLFTVPVAIAPTVRGALFSSFGVPRAMAVALLAALPVLLVYVLADRQVMGGVTLVGMAEETATAEDRRKALGGRPFRVRVGAAVAAWTAAGLAGYAVTAASLSSILSAQSGGLIGGRVSTWAALAPPVLLWPLGGLLFSLVSARQPGRRLVWKALLAALPIAAMLLSVWHPQGLLIRAAGMDVAVGWPNELGLPILVGIGAAAALSVRLYVWLAEHRYSRRAGLWATALACAGSVAILGVQGFSSMQRFSVPALYPETPATVSEVLSWSDVQQARSAPGDTPYATTGLHLYEIGDVDGGFSPRTNPYDLYNFGEPLPDDPLANELQGIWAQPVKALDGFVFEMQAKDDTWTLLDAQRFTQTYAGVQFDYEHGDLRAMRRDVVAQDRPVLLTTLFVTNTGRQDLEVRLRFLAYFDLKDAGFTSLAPARNVGQTVSVDGDRLVARARALPDTWAVAVGGDRAPERVRVTPSSGGQTVGKLEYTVHLVAGQTQAWTFGVAAESQGGAPQALQWLADGLRDRETLWAEKEELYRELSQTGPHLHIPDARLDAAFSVAQANLQMLEADSPALGRYFYAGLETFPFWFSNDGYYSLPGLLATGLVSPALNHVRIGAELAQQGRVAHQISPSGQLVGQGNSEETPQWVMAVWDAYRWTGDRDFLAEVYPAAVQGLFTYVLGTADQDADLYPEGPGMVERTGMGPEKVDAASYLWAALGDLAQLAEAMGDGQTSVRARSLATDLQARFDAQWWLPDQQVYADSVQSGGNNPLYAGHWTAVVPLEVGLASPDRAHATLDRLQRDYLNQWGLVHTLGSDQRVWTLPTATLSRAAFRLGDSTLGVEMLDRVAQTLDYGGIGLFHELIPEGLSFLQLWSAGTLVRGVVEDLMGVEVHAEQSAVTVAPRLPEAWEEASLENLRFAGHTISVSVDHGRVTVTHTAGPAPLAVTIRLPDGTHATAHLAPGEGFSNPE